MKKRPERITRVGLIANTEKPESRPLLAEAAQRLAAEGIDVLADAATARMSGLRLPRLRNTAQVAEHAQLLLVFGGDGTILRVAREIAGSTTPLLGIHVGRLGFLAGVTASELPKAVEQITTGDYQIENRSLMTAERSPKPNRHDPALRALNDFVFTRGDVSRMIELEVAVDGEELTRYRCDGLIISSATGSTAYSLAAGGAIVSPLAHVFTITPICPLTLSNRSVILDLDSTVVVRVGSSKLKTHLTADGQVAIQLRMGDEVTIRRARESVRLLRLGGSSFFRTLRQKLHWSGSHA